VDVITSFEDVNKAIQDQGCRISKGKEEYNRYVPQARGLARQLIFSAEGYAAQRINRATGETQRFSPLAADFARYPKVKRTRLYFEAFEQAFAGSNGTEIIDKKLSGPPPQPIFPHQPRYSVMSCPLSSPSQLFCDSW